VKTSRWVRYNGIMDKEELSKHISNLAFDDDLSDEDVVEADDASQALVALRRLFRGHPYEAKFTEMIAACDHIAATIAQHV
jgi:hypothetical protein